MWPDFTSSWRQVSLHKKRQRQDRIKNIPLNPIDTLAAQVYINATATEIVRHIGAGEWTAADVLTAYISRAISAQKHTNAITEVLFAQAFEEAKHLDEEFSRTGQIKGPLHGVPISFKDMFQTAGYDASIGFSTWCDKPSNRDADLVRIVREAGGIPMVKTNVPQTLLSFECSNPVFGRTTNPWSSAHTPGGSSGGEAALLACDGSALGFGTDIGGSLRIPAAFTGIYSLKPGPGRISHEGIVSPVKGFVGLDVVAGPMGRSVEDIDTACRLIFGRSTTTPAAVAPLPYQDIILPERLKFGYYLSDGCIKASPANQRAILETVTALRRAGHECVEFDPTHNPESFALFVGISSADAYSTLLSHLGPDPREKGLLLVSLGPKVPAFLRSIAIWVVQNVLGDTFFAKMLAVARQRDVTSFWQTIRKKDDYVKLYYQNVWNQYGFDGLIVPVFATPALPHGASKTLTPLAASTTIFNIVDSPVGVVPVTRVDPKLDALTDEWFNGSGRGSKILENGAFGTGPTSKGAMYDPVAMKGLPVGIQIVGKLWEDEKVLGMMKVVDDALGERGFGPGTWEPR